MNPAPMLDTRLADQLQIQRLVADYCWGLDLGDRDRFLSIWHEDAEWRLGGLVSADGIDAIAAAFDGLDGQFRAMHHLTSDLVVDWENDDTASGLAHAIGASTTRDGVKSLAVARYADRYARRAGRWGLVSRQATLFPLGAAPR